VAVTLNTLNDNLMATLDGVNWTDTGKTQTGALLFWSNTRLGAVAGTEYIRDKRGSDVLMQNFPGGAPSVGIVAADGTFYGSRYSVGGAGSLIYSSSDLTQWAQEATAGFLRNVHDCDIADDGTVVFIGQDATDAPRFCTRSPAGTWTKGNLPVTANGSGSLGDYICVRWGNGTWVVSGGQYNTKRTLTAVSADGLSWSGAVFDHTDSLGDGGWNAFVEWTGTRWLMTRRNATKVWTSAAGTGWSVRASSITGSRKLVNLPGRGRILMASTAGAKSSDDDGLSWTLRNASCGESMARTYR
jgi:hypothetical protein